MTQPAKNTASDEIELKIKGITLTIRGKVAIAASYTLVVIVLAHMSFDMKLIEKAYSWIA